MGFVQGEGGEGNIRTPVVLSGFQGKSMLLRVRKRPGLEDEDVLDEQAGRSACEPPPDDSLSSAALQMS